MLVSFICKWWSMCFFGFHSPCKKLFRVLLQPCVLCGVHMCHADDGSYITGENLQILWFSSSLISKKEMIIFYCHMLIPVDATQHPIQWVTHLTNIVLSCDEFCHTKIWHQFLTLHPWDVPGLDLGRETGYCGFSVFSLFEKIFKISHGWLPSICFTIYLSLSHWTSYVVWAVTIIKSTINEDAKHRSFLCSLQGVQQVMNFC
jgi:hypothetical protein